MKPWAVEVRGVSTGATLRIRTFWTRRAARKHAASVNAGLAKIQDVAAGVGRIEVWIVRNR